MNLKPLILKELGFFYFFFNFIWKIPCVLSLINIIMDPRTKTQFMYLKVEMIKSQSKALSKLFLF